MIYQLMFAIITPALITGAVAERIKFSGFLVFMLLWTTFIYDPLAHWVWGVGGWLRNLGALDFAGGTVVHISSGISALAAALMIGKRRGFGTEPMPPHNLPLTVTGAAMLWVGWFGFNAGSALSAGALATSAFVATHIASAAATLAWMLTEWLTRGKPTVLGAASGAVAGLVAITPASGYVGPLSAIVIGGVGGILCFTPVTSRPASDMTTRWTWSGYTAWGEPGGLWPPVSSPARRSMTLGGMVSSSEIPGNSSCRRSAFW